VQKPLHFARELVSGVLAPGGYAVDATCGNGHDTLFLAGLVGRSGRVLAMDVQEQALEETRRRLREANMDSRVQLVLASHSELSVYLERSPDAVMFNLGYLPGGDKGLVTRPETTLLALQSVLRALKKGGLVTMVVYTGHPGGAAEYEALQSYTAALPQAAYTVLEYRLLNQINYPPLLLAVLRL
jgi:ubiquinone/menaquinone biosynthesis C-methylase UbiE